MYTQCPECGTIFKVTPDVLRVARGVVRCGVCDSTFNAVHYLSEKPAPVSTPQAARRLAPRESVATPTPAGLASLHAQVAAFQAAQPDTATTGRFAARLATSLREAEHERAWTPPATTPAETTLERVGESPAPAPTATPRDSAPQDDLARVAARRRDAEIEAAPDTALEFDPVATDWNTVFISPSPRPMPPEPDAAAAPPEPAPRVPHGPSDRHAGTDDGEGEQTLAGHADADPAEFEYGFDELGQALPPPARAERPDAQALERLFRSTAAAAAGVQHKSAAGRFHAETTMPASADEPATPDAGPGTPFDPGHPAGDAAVTDDFSDEPDAAAEPHVAAADEDSPAGTAPAQPPVQRYGPPTRSAEPLTLTMPAPHTASPGYAIAAAVALLALAAQGAHYWREALAALPVAGPLVQRAYEAAGYPLEPRWSLTDYDVKQLGVSSDVPGTLRLLARVQNRAARAQPYPLLRVTLLDRFETKIARREFTPAEYLPSRRRPEGILPPDQRVDADLLLADPGNDAVSFELDLCLYDHNRLHCAQDVRAVP